MDNFFFIFSVDCGLLCWWMKFRQDPNYYGYVKFRVTDIHLSASATLDFKTMTITELKSFDLHEEELTIDISSFEIKIHGDPLGLVGAILKGVVAAVDYFAKNAILDKVEEPIKDAIKKELIGKDLMELAFPESRNSYL